MTEHSSFAQENYECVPYCSQYLFLVYRVWRSKASHQKAVTGVGSRGNLRVSRNTLFRPWWGLINLFPRSQNTSVPHFSPHYDGGHTAAHFAFGTLLFSLPLLYLILFSLICDNSYD